LTCSAKVVVQRVNVFLNVLTFSLILAVFTVVAYGKMGYGQTLTAEQAREARKKGHVQSLRAVVKSTLKQFPGKLLKAELSHHNEQWIYALVLFQEGGYITKVWVDAEDGRLIDHQSRKKRKHRHRKINESSDR